MQFNHYGGEAALLAADLVNLPSSSLTHEVAAVLSTHGIAAPHPTPDQAHQLLGWATRLAPCFGTEHSHEQCRLVNELPVTAASKPYISVHNGHRHTCITALSTRTWSPGCTPSPPQGSPT